MSADVFVPLTLYLLKSMVSLIYVFLYEIYVMSSYVQNSSILRLLMSMIAYFMSPYANGSESRTNIYKIPLFRSMHGLWLLTRLRCCRNNSDNLLTQSASNHIGVTNIQPVSELKGMSVHESWFFHVFTGLDPRYYWGPIPHPPPPTQQPRNV